VPRFSDRRPSARTRTYRRAWWRRSWGRLPWPPGFGGTPWQDLDWKRSFSLVTLARSLRCVGRDTNLEPSVRSMPCNRRKVAIAHPFLAPCATVMTSSFLTGEWSRCPPTFKTRPSRLPSALVRASVVGKLRVALAWSRCDAGWNVWPAGGTPWFRYLRELRQ